MEYRRLGESGLSVSEIAYGNWITHASQVDEQAARDCVEASLEAGINTFDTADVYAEGGAEEVLGRALKGTRREGLVLCTKVERPMGNGPNDKGLSRKHMFESCHASLRRLGTDYIDVYYAHRFDETVPLEETMLAFADLVRQGKVLYVGVSEWSAEQISRAGELARELQVPLVASQPQYSMLWRVIEEEVVPASRQDGMGQVVWSPQAQGVLSGKYLPGEAAPTGSRAADPAGKGFMNALAGRWMQEDALSAVQKLQPIAKEAGLSLPQLAVAWVLQNAEVSAAIIGASRPEQVRENAGASGVKLADEVMRQIDGVLGDIVERDPSRSG